MENKGRSHRGLTVEVLAMAKVGVWATLWIAAWAASRPIAGQEPRFTLEFASASPERFSGVAGDSFGPFEVSAALRPAGLSGRAGPHGWSIAVRHDPLLELLQVTADGTNAGGLLDPRIGFLHIEMIDSGEKTEASPATSRAPSCRETARSSSPPTASAPSPRPRTGASIPP